MSGFKRNRNFITNSINDIKIDLGIDYIDKNLLKTLKFGNMVVLEEDPNTYYTEVALRMFLSHNLTYKPDTNIYTISRDHSEIKIPTIVRKDLFINSHEVEKMVIAWRYNKLKTDKQVSNYNMSKKLDLNDKKYIFINNISEDEFISLLNKSPKKSIFVIFSLLSPRWHNFKNKSGDEIEKFLFKVKMTVKKNDHFLVVSIPSFLYDEAKINVRLYFDVVLEFKTFLFSTYLPNYSGIITLKKNYSLYNLEERNIESDRVGFISSIAGIVAEKIIIPPEDASGDVLSCSNTDLF